MYARRGYDAAMKYLSHYEQRLARLFDFLREHYVHAPDVYRLAEEAHLSPWHLHRLYHSPWSQTQQSEGMGLISSVFYTIRQ